MWALFRDKNNPYSENPYYERTAMSRRHYGILNFLFDALLVILTGGLWLIWIFVREIRG